MDQFKDTKTISWIDRWKAALAGLIFAPLFIFVGFAALREGEIEHAQTTNALKNIQPNIKKENMRIQEIFFIKQIP
jgi:hypothetical protein